MKKITLLSLCALIGAGAMAQEAVIKEAEKAMKKDGNFAEVVRIMTPAMSEPSTASNVLTYYIPGKTGFAQFDKLFGMQQLGKLDDAGREAKANALLGGYEYFMKALPLDSVVDEKGKMKTKYSKEIINTIAGHYQDFYATGVDFWDFKNYDGAYKVWDAYLTLPQNPAFAKSITAPNDTVLADVMFNQALAAWQMDDFERALNSFINAKNHGYNKKQLYDYAIAVASASKNDAAITELATEAQQLYGAEDSNYIGFIINNCLNEKRYSDAVAMINQAIANDPNNAQYHVIKGILFETDDVDGDPKAEYEKAVAIDDHNAQALYNLGRMYYNEALAIYNDAPADDAGFNKVFFEQFKPVMLKATDLFEKASAIDEDNIDALKLLEQAYYMLNDETNLKATQARLGK